MRLTTGVRLGQYEIVAVIGAGGMGEVYRARDTQLNRNVALKILPKAFAHAAGESSFISTRNRANVRHLTRWQALSDDQGRCR
jgi:serine/threonine protein kinase